MKFTFTSGKRPLKSSQAGSATLVVLVFLTIMAVYLVGNNLTLNNLKQDLRVVEKRQLRKYREPVVVQQAEAGMGTNNLALKAVVMTNE